MLCGRTRSPAAVERTSLLLLRAAPARLPASQPASSCPAAAESRPLLRPASKPPRSTAVHCVPAVTYSCCCHPPPFFPFSFSVPVRSLLLSPRATVLERASPFGLWRALAFAVLSNAGLPPLFLRHLPLFIFACRGGNEALGKSRQGK